MEELIESATLVTIRPNMSLLNYYNSSAGGCFNFSGDGTEVNAQMLREMKTFSPCLLVFYCVVNMSLGFLSCVGNALVILTVVSFSELHTATNIGLTGRFYILFCVLSVLTSSLMVVHFFKGKCM